MSERYFRIVIGLWLIAALFLDSLEAIYVLCALLLIEGISNYRIPALVSRLRYGKLWQAEIVEPDKPSTVSFEAERALRFIVAGFVIVSQQASLDMLWWLSWFVGFALIGAGLSGICPMVLTLRRIGLR